MPLRMNLISWVETFIDKIEKGKTQEALEQRIRKAGYRRYFEVRDHFYQKKSASCSNNNLKNFFKFIGAC